MIRVRTGMPAGVAGVEAGGKVTGEDYTKALAPALDAATKDVGVIRIVPGEVRALRAGERDEAIAWAAITPEQS